MLSTPKSYNHNSTPLHLITRTRLQRVCITYAFATHKNSALARVSALITRTRLQRVRITYAFATHK
jgi:hypothetical protein